MVDIYFMLMIIDTITLFFNGFSFRRRHIPLMLVSSLVILLVSGLAIVLNGIGTYVNTLSNVDIYGAVASVVYVFFWWVSGYMIGGIQRITDKDKNMRVGNNRM